MTNDLPHGEAAADTSSQVRPQNLDRGGNTRPGHFYRQTLETGIKTALAREIIAQVGKKHGIPVNLIFGLITGRRRDKRIVAVRHEAIRRARLEARLSTTQLGRIFNRDHTTILYACKKTIAASAPTRLGAMETNGA